MAHILHAMSVTRELRRRLSPDRSLRPFEPCVPRPREETAGRPGWIHEIKHNGFRILARRDVTGVRLVTSNGYNFADRFPMIVAALENLPVRSCSSTARRLLSKTGLLVFDLIRSRQRAEHRSGQVPFGCGTGRVLGRYDAANCAR